MSRPTSSATTGGGTFSSSQPIGATAGTRVPGRGFNLLFCHADARAAHFRRHVLHLRQPVPDPQLRLLIIDMDAGAVREARNDRRIHVGEPHAGMLGEDVAAAGLAPFAIAMRRLAVSA